jgi:replicative superfamily II helicase
MPPCLGVALANKEQANSLVNAAIEDRSIGMLGAVVIDELHMIDDESRGYILELMATKLLSLGQDVQIIGMSATINVCPAQTFAADFLAKLKQNAELLANWLDNAKFYISKYRPVLVEEHLVFDNAVYPASTSSRFYKTATQLNAQTQLSSQAKPEPSRIIQPSQYKEFGNPLINAVVSLANETARAGYGALIFCSSRAGCERDAVLVSQVLPRPEDVATEIMDMRFELLSELRSTSTGLDSNLEKTIPVGVAFHRKLVVPSPEINSLTFLQMQA